MLIRGTKWDMRIYVLVTQMRPMKIYLYQEGIVRFSADRYDTSTITNLYSHLTNSSINKHAPSQISNSYGAGLKWSMEQLRHYFRDNGYDYEAMWCKIEQIINLTCINLCSVVPNLDCCFELLGFDIMLDDKMKPWLIEVNSSPALGLETPTDRLVKPALIRDTIGLTHFETYSQFRVSKFVACSNSKLYSDSCLWQSRFEFFLIILAPKI